MNVCKNVFRGRPVDMAERIEKERRCYELLDRLGIAYTRVDHDFADTIEACEAVEAVLGEKICKNLQKSLPLQSAKDTVLSADDGGR